MKQLYFHCFYIHDVIRNEKDGETNALRHYSPLALLRLRCLSIIYNDTIGKTQRKPQNTIKLFDEKSFHLTSDKVRLLKKHGSQRSRMPEGINFGQMAKRKKIETFIEICKKKKSKSREKEKLRLLDRIAFSRTVILSILLSVLSFIKRVIRL